MKDIFMAIDIGSTSIKGMLIDNDGNIISKYYLKIKEDYVTTYGRVINKLRSSVSLNEYRICSFKLTGIRKRLLERSLGKEHFNNEINCLVNYVNKKYSTGTIIDIGNRLKIINFKDDKIINYVIDDFNYYGKFIDKLSEQLSIDNVNDIKTSKTRVKFKNTNTILFNYNIINILLKKYSKEEIIFGGYDLVVNNIIHNLKNIVLRDNIIVTGGVSLNKTFIKELELLLNKKIIIIDNSEFSSCIGLANTSKEKTLIHK